METKERVFYPTPRGREVTVPQAEDIIWQGKYNEEGITHPDKESDYVYLTGTITFE